ncbi:MAG: hypothetical protein Q9183_006881 [Haloplaca sp. 2 TL-2023]
MPPEKEDSATGSGSDQNYRYCHALRQSFRYRPYGPEADRDGLSDQPDDPKADRDGLSDQPYHLKADRDGLSDQKEVYQYQKPYARSHAEIALQPANPPQTDAAKTTQLDLSIARARIYSKVAELEQRARQAAAVKNREFMDDIFVVRLGEDKVPAYKLGQYFKDHPEKDEMVEKGLLEMKLVHHKGPGEYEELKLLKKYAALFDQKTSDEEWNKLYDELEKDPESPFYGKKGR